MKKLAILCIAILMCVCLSGCAFLRNMLPVMLDRVSTQTVTSTPRVVQSTTKPKATPTPTPKPTATPTAEPEESQPQGIQLPIAP